MFRRYAAVTLCFAGVLAASAAPALAALHRPVAAIGFGAGGAAVIGLGLRVLARDGAG